jgi:hypothetical protein
LSFLDANFSPFSFMLHLFHKMMLSHKLQVFRKKIFISIFPLPKKYHLLFFSLRI